MAHSEEQKQFTRKIEELRKRLMGDLNLEELQRMQLQIDLLERATGGVDFHHHDTNEHHDHVTKPVFEEIAKKPEQSK
jgi:hypothetical protein